MRSKQIDLKLTPSKLPLVALLLAFICGYIISHYIPELRYFVFGVFVIICFFWLYKYLTFKEHKLIINTTTREILLNNIPIQAIKFRQISWWLSIIYLYRNDRHPQVHDLALDPRVPHACVPHACVRGDDVVIYLFADSVPFKSYKSFKIYSQWT